MSGAVPAVLPLDGPVRDYAWGSRTLLAELRGEPASDVPEAEVWFGAHPAAPATVHLPAGPVPLDASGLPLPRFLLKLLAAGAPLSIQLHPDRATAEAGFAAEDTAGIPRDAAIRTYRDPYDKPELLRALTPMRLLVGARPRDEALRVLSALLPGDAVAAVLAADGLRGAAAELLGAATGLTIERLAALRSALDAPVHADPALAAAGRLARELLTRHPEDAGVIVALLLRPVDLAPGEAVFVPAGLPHAYLAGLGVEVMRASDNVVRGGLTTKHVDVPALVRLLDPEPVDARVERRAEGAWIRHAAPTEAFTLHEAEVAGEAEVPGAAGPRIILCAEGEVTVAAGGTEVVLAAGRAAYLLPGSEAGVRGRGLVLVAA